MKTPFPESHKACTPFLYARDIDVIRAAQHAQGGYPAAPTFSPYRYTWFRDGAFIAYAMDIAGAHWSARRFHAWAVRVIERHRGKAERALERVRRGMPLGREYLHARYTLTGEEADDEWPNFQLDGLGTWLWALVEHQRRTDFALPSRWRDVVTLVASYLATLWPVPCYDLWEESDARLHVYTLASIFAGLRAASQLVDGSWVEEAERIRDFILCHGVDEGHFVKDISCCRGYMPVGGIDASLVGVSVPYGVVAPTDPRARATIERIEEELHRPGGGVYRYPGDTYYGGGEWLLTSAWLGWYYAVAGEPQRARELLIWVEAQANARGFLPEQVTTYAQFPKFITVWQKRWGNVASPLLWSHAMHLILCHALREPKNRPA